MNKYLSSFIIFILVSGIFVISKAPCAKADFINFDQSRTNMQGGTVSFDGGANPLIGTGILFDQIIGLGTPDNDGVTKDIFQASLSFETGTNISAGVWSHVGSTFTLSGAFIDGGTPVALLSGVFTSSINVLDLGATWFVSGEGADTKHDGITDFYGVTSLGWIFANTEMSLFGHTGTIVGGFTAEITQADINNYKPPGAVLVPEPGIALLLGISLIGLVVVGVTQRFKGTKKE